MLDKGSIPTEKYFRRSFAVAEQRSVRAPHAPRDRLAKTEGAQLDAIGYAIE